MGLTGPPAPPTEPPPESETFHFDQDRWNRARKALEQGREPDQEPPPAEVLVSTAPAAPPEEEPGIEVDLPYESGLSITGRKLIALKLKRDRYRSAKRAQELGVSRTRNEFEMKQELQVRIKGKVGRKITVNVDFDDTQEDKRDISVVYQGDPEEIVQEAAFGDITLALPNTEFVSFNKQLFGVSTRLKYKRAQLMAIGSRTKGITETKRFSGNVVFERKEISDNAYVRRSYYQLPFDPSNPPIGQEEIWKDDRNSTTDNASTEDKVGEEFGVPGSTVTGRFDRLAPNTDYVVDFDRGYIFFKRALQASDVIIVDYTLRNGTRLSADTGVPKILKRESDDAREIKTFYNIGRQGIVRDNGRGNFILKTIDTNRNDIDVHISTTNALLRYPSNLAMDFEQGVFNISPPSTSTRVTDVDAPGLYAGDSPPHAFSFLLEYRYRLKTYLVKPNIVFGSDRVQVNGRLLTRDLDYFIDYDSGFLTFINDSDVDETTQIEVTYEYAPFGGQLGQTLVGSRAEFSVIPDKMFFGSTILYTFAPKPAFIPDVRSTPSSLMVLEADARFANVRAPWIPVTLTNLSGEIAQSRENPNLFGNALIDSMEGIKQEDALVMDHRFWQVSRNPGGEVSRPSALASIGNQDVKLKEINPQSQADNDQMQRVLDVQYNLSVSTLSIIQAISAPGRDFTKKLFLDVWVEGSGSAGTNVDLIVDAGQFNEDADADTSLDTEDVNRDAALNIGEDVGWTFNDPGPDAIPGTADDAVVRVGADNSRLDTEDLDADGNLDTLEVKRSTPLFQLSGADNTANGVKIVNPQTGAEESTSIKHMGFTGWRLIQVPLNIKTGEETLFRNVKQVRVTLIGPGPAAGQDPPRMRIGQLSFTGNRWEALPVSGATITVSAVNNFDDPRYVSLVGNPHYNDLYQDDNRERVREQALSLKFDLPAVAGSSVTARLGDTAIRDFSKHKAVRFFVRTPSATLGETLFVQFGSETDFFEYSFPVTVEHKDIWALEGANLVDVNNDGIPDKLEPLKATGATRIVGNPRLTNVGQIRVGVRNDASPVAALSGGEIWINEMHLTGARLKVGNAKRVGADVVWDKWASFGAKFRDVDRNFQTLTSPITNQDRRDESGYVTFNRLSFLPLSGNASRSLTVTPAAIRTGESSLVSVLEEGRVESYTLHTEGDLLLPRMPQLGFGYDKSLTDTTLLRRIDDRDTYSGDLSFTVPWRPDILPGRALSLRLLPESGAVSYRRTNYFLSFYPAKKTEESANPANLRNAVFTNATTVEFTDDWSARLNFTPWDGLSLAPNYSLKVVREERRFNEVDLSTAPDFDEARSYPKALSQTAGITGSWRVLRWLEPRFSHTVSGTETNNLPTASTPTAYNLKSLNRTGATDLNWSFNVRDLIPNFRPVQSLSVNNTYSLQDADTYDNLARDYDGWRRRLWIRTPLDLPDAQNPQAKRRLLTQSNSYRSSSNWSPLDWLNARGRWEPIKTLNATATFTRRKDHQEAIDTPPKDTVSTTWPDLLFSLRDLEKLYGFQKFMDNSVWNFRTSRRETEVLKVNLTESRDLNTDYRFTLWRRYDLFLSYGANSRFDKDLRTGLLNSTGEGYNYSTQAGMTFGSWRITPSYNFKIDTSRNGLGVITADLKDHIYSLKARFDKAYPAGFRVPFTKKVFGNVNRLTVDSGLTLDQKRSRYRQEDNTDTYTANTTGEYEISRNFRLSFGGGGSLVKNRVKKENDFMSFEITSSLVIQF